MKHEPYYKGSLFSAYFKLVQPEEHPEANCYFPQYDFSTSMIFPNRPDFVRGYLYRETKKHINLNQLKTCILENCATLTKQVDRLKNALLGTLGTELIDDEKAFCTNAFTVVFVLEDESKLKKIGTGSECRAKSKLKLGQDIKTIATATRDIETVQAFLRSHNLANVEVISLDQLQATKVSTQSIFKQETTKAQARDERPNNNNNNYVWH